MQFDNFPLKVRQFGLNDRNAPPMLLLHGRSDSGECWPDAIKHWAARYRIIAPDARGHGLSPRFTRAEIEADPIQLMARDAEILVARVAELDRSGQGLIVLGASMGAGLAAFLAANHGDLMRAAILEEPTWYSKVDWAARMADGVAKVRDAREWRDNFQSKLREEQARHPQWTAEELTALGTAKVQMDDAFIATGKGFLDIPWRQIARAIKIPSLVITGTSGNFTDADRDGFTKLSNPNLTIKTVSSFGHSVRRDNPHDYYRLVDGWLASL